MEKKQSNVHNTHKGMMTMSMEICSGMDIYTFIFAWESFLKAWYLSSQLVTTYNAGKKLILTSTLCLIGGPGVIPNQVGYK